MCHSSKQKLFVNKLKEFLPGPIQAWIDDKEIVIGENIQTSITKAINDCDFFIVVIDENALNSAWVLKEIKLALKKEKKLKRLFVLPIVLDNASWNKIDISEIKSKKYLPCHSLNPADIEVVAKELISEIFTWLCREFDNKNSKSGNNKLIDINNFNKGQVHFYDAYGYSTYRKDLFYYKIKMFSSKDDLNKKVFFIELLTFDIKLKQDGAFNGIAYVNGNYAYFTIYIRNLKKEVKREFYMILFLGDKAIEDYNIGFATYCISSRDMNLAAGELLMQRVKNDLIPKNLPLEISRYFQMKKPQLRTQCKPLLNLNDIVIDTDQDLRLLDSIGSYKIIFFQFEKSEKILCQYKLVINENLYCYIYDGSENLCNIRVIDNNLHIGLLNNKFTIISDIISPISKKSVFEGVFAGINNNHTPNSGKIIFVRTNKKVKIGTYHKTQLKTFFDQDPENKKLYELLIASR
jgi:hypothetical protein